MFSSGRDEKAHVEGIENPAFDRGGSAKLSVPLVWLEKEIRGDRPDSTLVAHQKKMELQAPAKERGEASFFISLKSVDRRCTPDLTSLSLSFPPSLPPPFFLPRSERPLVLAFQCKRVQTGNPRISSSSAIERYSSGCSFSI